MKCWASLLVVLCLANAGCATLATGQAALPLNAAGQALPESAAPLVIRSREISDVSIDHVPVLEVTFENHSNQWRKISTPRILVANPESAGPVQIPPPEALHDWHVAAQQRKRVRDANRDTALELGTTGALVIADAAMESKDEDVQIAGAVFGLLALSVLTAAHYGDRKHEAESLTLAQENHLYAGPISLPPLTTVKRWVLLYTPGPRDTTGLRLVLSYDLAEHGTQRVLLRSEPARPRHRAPNARGQLLSD